MVLEKNKDTFPHRHPEREREDNYEKRIRRVKKKNVQKLKCHILFDRIGGDDMPRKGQDSWDWGQGKREKV